MKELDYIFERWGFERKSVVLCPNHSRSYSLARLYGLLGYKIGVEVGVERAIFSKTICRRSPNIKLYGIDPWLFYSGYREHVPQERLDGFFRSTKERMKGCNFQIIRDFSMSAVKRFKDNSLDFVYIDGNHEYKWAKEDIEAWHKKVRVGGIISGHDYGNVKYMQSGGQKQTMRVKQAVDEWVEKNKIKHLFLFAKGDKYPSWFYVKEI